LLHDTGPLQCSEIGSKRAVTDRRLGSIQLDREIVELEGCGGGQQVLDRLHHEFAMA
jgi:hypothetical protein